MKTYTKRWLVAILLAVVTTVAACAATPAPTATPVDTGVATTEPSVREVVDIDRAVSKAVLDTVPPNELTEAEVQGILYMREEEKLARDVYLAMHELWGIPIFENIANSEATHMAAVRDLIDRYGLQDPASDQIGVFANSTLQDLYDELVQVGSQSLVDALRVGAAIEEIDILDLKEHIAQTDEADIRLVYDNLTRGSRNHLRSFVRNLNRRTDEVYQPQYLDQAAYEAIVNSSMERGRDNG